ncbi:hypothetical protein H9L39_14103 [Fusarium oxysporum f. sp. albedinis]|nr:hypothetical protein H9L39_14103 [Fusarium oxysporum f. sp. albedinis]
MLSTSYTESASPSHFLQALSAISPDTRINTKGLVRIKLVTQVYKKLAMPNIQLQSNSANTLFYTTSIQYLNFLSTFNLK